MPPLSRTAAAAAAAACVLLAGGAAAGEGHGLLGGRALETARLTATGPLFTGTLVHGPRRPAFTARRSYWGGPITAKTGEIVNVTVSESYPVDQLRRQEVADFLVDLVHGPELSALTLYLAPPAEVASLCGEAALGCYSALSQLMIAPGEDLADGTSMQTILAHEYGHHVAANRDNAPWPALDWGPKRWASVANVCKRRVAGTAFPGDAGANYSLNPGEAFAETYRLLNFQRRAWPSWAAGRWRVDQSWYPDSAALDAALDDVLHPWVAGTGSSWHGRFAAPRKPAAKRGQPAKPLVVTRLITPARDGLLSIQLDRAPRGTTVRVLDPLTSKAVGPASTAETRGTICGQRRLKLTLTSPSPGNVSVTIRLP